MPINHSELNCSERIEISEGGRQREEIVLECGMLGKQVGLTNLTTYEWGNLGD